MRGRLLLLAAAFVACARDEGRVAPAGSTAAAPPASGAQPAPAGAKAPCPATGLWSECAVVERLERAGLAPRVDSRGATEAPLSGRGTLIQIGRSELELYVYPDVGARERDQGKLDRAKYLAADAPIGMTPQPTMIPSANLIAILHSRNDHQRERVSDALAAGPPQPSRP